VRTNGTRPGTGACPEWGCGAAWGVQHARTWHFDCTPERLGPTRKVYGSQQFPPQCRTRGLCRDGSLHTPQVVISINGVGILPVFVSSIIMNDRQVGPFISGGCRSRRARLVDFPWSSRALTGLYFRSIARQTFRCASHRGPIRRTASCLNSNVRWLREESDCSPDTQKCNIPLPVPLPMNPRGVRQSPESHVHCREIPPVTKKPTRTSGTSISLSGCFQLRLN
jgi:hypothetical protein